MPMRLHLTSSMLTPAERIALTRKPPEVEASLRRADEMLSKVEKREPTIREIATYFRERRAASDDNLSADVEITLTPRRRPS